MFNIRPKERKDNEQRPVSSRDAVQRWPVDRFAYFDFGDTIQFVRQVGLTMKETLNISEVFARIFPGNAGHGKPFSLDPDTARFIAVGFKIGQDGLYGPPANR